MRPRWLQLRLLLIQLVALRRPAHVSVSPWRQLAEQVSRYHSNNRRRRLLSEFARSHVDVVNEILQSLPLDLLLAHLFGHVGEVVDDRAQIQLLKKYLTL